MLLKNLRLVFCYLKVFAESRVDAARSYKDRQHASEGKLCNDRVGTFGEGPNGVAIGTELLLHLPFLVGWVLWQTTADDVAQLRLGNLRWKFTN